MSRLVPSVAEYLRLSPPDRLEGHRRSRILLIGEAPARDPRKSGLEIALIFRALGIPRSRWSMALLGTYPSMHRFYLTTMHANLLAGWPGRSGKGSAFPRKVAARAACEVETHAVSKQGFPWSYVLFAGKRVGDAFPSARGQEFLRHFRWRPFPESESYVPAYVVPHPSGVSTWWNAAYNRDRCASLLRRLGKQATQDEASI